MELSVIIAIIGVLVALTNVIVEVAKKATWDKLPTNILALIVGEVLYRLFPNQRHLHRLVYDRGAGGGWFHGGLCGNVRF